MKLVLYICFMLLAFTGSSDEYLFPIVENEKWGYMNSSGNIIIQPQFEFAFPFAEKLGLVNIGGTFRKDYKRRWNKWSRAEGGKWGYIDKNGNYKIEPIYYKAESFSEGLAPVKENKEVTFFFIDNDGAKILEVDYAEVYLFTEGLCSFRPLEWGEGFCGFMDKQGNVVIEANKYGEVGTFSEGLAPVIVGNWETGKSGYINKDGEIVIQAEYDGTFEFSEGLAPVMYGKYGSNDGEDCIFGFINKKGETIIPFKYDWAFGFSEGLAPIGYNVEFEGCGLWGYIDKAGNKVIKEQYNFAYPFKHGLAMVMINWKWAYIDKNENIVWKEE